MNRRNQQLNFKLQPFKEIGPLVALVLLILIFSLISPYFFKLNNLLNIVRQISLIGIISIGMVTVIVSGEFDLSVGSVYGLSAIITGLSMTNGVPIWLAIIFGLGAGIVIGVINGLIVTYGNIPSFIVTLGTLNIARAIALLMSKGYIVNLSDKTVRGSGIAKFFFMGQGRLFGVLPTVVVFFIIICIAGYLVFNKSLIGFHMKAVGGNQEAARASGINVRKIKIISFCITGFLGAFSGILDLSFMGTVQGTVGTGLELSVIAAVIIGGTTLIGGSGTILGAIIGILIIGILKNGLVLIGISPFWQMLLIGVVIIGAVGIDTWTRKRTT